MTWRNRVGIIVLSVLLVVLGFYVYERLGIRMGGNPSSLRSPFHSEEEWIVEEIVRDIAEMAAYGHSLARDSVEISQELVPGKPLPSVRLKVGVGSLAAYEDTLPLAGSFWNPDNYSGLARKLLGPALAGAKSPTPSSLPEALLDARAVVLEKESERISALLAADIRDPSAHEEAALVLAAFALREAAYAFEDFRFLLGRTTAHLAVARSLRGGEAPGASGAIAEAALLTLEGREKEAQEAIDRLSGSASPAAASWRNALTMYSTLDWRGRPGGEDSLLERVQRFRAMILALHTSAAVARTPESVESDLADWGRMVTWQYGGAASDRPFITTQMGRELAELQEVWRIKKGSPLSPRDLANELNVPDARLVGDGGPEVLGWGTWAAFYQRHICGLLAAAEKLLAESLGTPDWAAEYRRQAQRVFSGLTLNPIVDVRRTRKVGGRVEDTLGMDESIEIARRHPELMNPENWDFLTDTAGHMMRKRGMPRAESWFSRAVLETSVFDTGTRYRVLNSLVGDGDEVFASLVGIAPRHAVVVDWAIDRLPNEQTTVERLTKELGARVEFDVDALRQLRDAAKDAAERASILGRMCDLDANDCDSLGWEYVELDRPEEAAAAFQNAVDEAPDRIGVCNSVYWLVNYYFDRGRVGEAREIAAMAADVYCGWGLLTQAYLSERMGRPVEAEKWYRAQAERYDAENPVSYPLLGFYYRMARVQKSEEFEPALEEMLPRVFPKGLEPLPAAFDAAPPTDGVLIDGDAGKLRDAGLRGADVVVGLDGFRVHSLEQYDAVRNFQAILSDAKDMRLRVFRQTQYLDVKARVSGRLNRRFGVHVRTYGTPGPSVEYR